ncbi:MAG TPA: hypothetical protein VGN32_09230 [Ktedonobacterales bacterium]|jgi:hypothetical protein|nr:hypothetical protein [Ktedonobacterales bacterium]
MPETDLHARRLAQWCQSPATRLADASAGAALIQRLGIATLYPASPEVPDLFHAFMGDPDAKTEPQWDTPSGEVYSWRWKLGRAEAGFYCVLVRNRPTWVSWELLPAVLRLCGEQRTPDELYDAGELSPAAYRVAQALERAGGVLSTGELRQEAGFPTGKEQRTAYLKAVDELDARLLVAKTFVGEEDELRHALVARRYREQVAVSQRFNREQAWERVLATYLPAAAYAVPTMLARHLKLDEAELRASLERLVAAGRAAAITLAPHKGACYAWRE